MRTICLLLVLLMFPSFADAGRCWRKSYHTLRSSYGWSHSCYSCHRKKQRTWKDDIASIAAKKEEYSAFVQALAALNLPQYSAQASATAYSGSPYAAQGSTVYGYPQSLSAFSAQLNVSPTAMMDQSTRLTTQAQQLSGAAMSDHTALIQALSAGQIEVAKTLAQGHAAAQALNSARAVTPVTDQTFTVQTGIQTQSVKKSIVSVVDSRCSGCHNATTLAGEFDITDPAGFAVRADKILSRITHPDPEKRMPRSAEGPGEPLPISEKRLFFRAFE